MHTIAIHLHVHRSQHVDIQSTNNRFVSVYNFIIIAFRRTLHVIITANAVITCGRTASQHALGMNDGPCAPDANLCLPIPRGETLHTSDTTLETGMLKMRL